MTSALNPLDLVDWIEANADSFRPPVANRVVWPDSELIFMVIRGPNARNDFHIDPGDEIFYQLQGTIQVDVRNDDGDVESHLVHEGALLLVPAGVPHSPLRPAESWGVVIERRRRAGELDQIRWYCENGHVLHERSFQLADIETELKAILDEFNETPSLRTCDQCGCVLEVAPPFAFPDP
ncbi:MAG: 3-hydroxyanthranilate 3,4-dioxygenase [Acidimicrobiia bacterium]|nr:3-hydroxyanthranilate 3,4-dioxygenase [Acidimicrobiia bacterium]MDH5238835.1 3-hydroxyanthranilate 3,4-dioxygenase [Acidimicrobiia bacterium]